MDLESKINRREGTVGVMGLGYVGLPLALSAERAGFSVIGIDPDPQRIASLSGDPGAPGLIKGSEVMAGHASGRLTFTVKDDPIAVCDVVVICVPTPLKHDLPDMTYVEAAATSVAKHLHPGQLIILESTTYPGTTEELLLKILESSGLKAGVDFYLGFSPERIDPGNETYTLTNVPKIVGGIDEKSTDLMEAFYTTFIDTVVRVSSPRAAEMAKLLENTYRHVNIALVNEIAILCHDLGIDIWEVIDAAATKPFGFQPFYPGPGWGGHCIPVDPAYLSWRVRQMGATARFVELAREFNQKMPGYVVQRITEALNDLGTSLKGSKILVMGVAYKADIEDIRESPALEIIDKLLKAGSDVSFADPYVASIPTRNGEMTARLWSDVADYDLVLVHTDHSAFDWPEIVKTARSILDTRNALAGLEGPIVKL